ncbi:MAG: ABC transporter ATP-binding protein [Firmicutes bacterium]|jgi:peptide/nickel transport system ATP-binding protein|nr:ABC transporter ATP-binding protein [Bacillota bacterium]MDH7495353.1 ABC transporter ATP-binding protein [Bacillota bacterium]
MPLLEVRDLKIYYKTTRGCNKAVDGVSFSVDHGESVGLVGESGCGKSTSARGIIRVMPRNMYIAGGKVIFEGEDLVRLPESKMRGIRWNKLSLIPQAAMDSLNPVYPVLDQFVEVLRQKGGLGRREARERAGELFRMVGLDTQRLRYYPHEFSGGMKQRAVIALALALNPRLVIADEPVTALDVIVQKQILGELKRLRRDLGLSLIMITHDVSVVADVCESVVVMYAGKVVEMGAVRDVLKSPAHPYTMGLRNAFPDLRNPRKTLISIEGSPPDLIELPDGCRFAGRCPFRAPQCGERAPELVEVSPGHHSACFRLDDIDLLRRRAEEVETWQRADMS